MSWSEVRTERASLLPELGAAEAGTAQAQTERRVRAVVREAERQAQELVEAARQRAAGVLEEAYREGMLQGRGEALSALQGQLASVLAALSAVTQELRSVEASLHVRATQVVLELACELAGRILGRELARDGSRLEAAVRAALEALPAPGPARVRVHPAIRPLLASLWEGGGQPAPDLELLEDARLDPSACLVESGLTLVDAGFPTQLAEARRRLLQEPW